MKQLSSLLFLLLATTSFAQAQCLQNAAEVTPQLSSEARRDFDSRLADARADYEKNPNDVERRIWLGRRTAYLGQYKEAIKIYTEAIKLFPADARLYRHRGHRLITLRCFDAALADFEKAARLIRGKPDEIEPDGLPNARNIPTSTLQSNIWYHLGLAHYLKGDFRRALNAYREAINVSRNPDMLVATTHWLYMTLRRLGRAKEAADSLKPISDSLEVIENADYLKLLRLYQGKLQPLDIADRANDNLSSATLGYGLGNWLLYNHQRAEAKKIWRGVTSGNQWASFGYIAAETDLKRSSPAAKPR